MTIDRFLQLLDSPEQITLTVGAWIVGVFFGGWVTHRYAICRDRRRDRNEVVDRLRVGLIRARDTPVLFMPSAVDIDLLRQLTCPIRWRRIDRALRQYEEGDGEAGLQELLHLIRRT
jgi:CRISPR/Cas system CMR subunit Cmr4 (Cas7 group RAMP superfamily)